MSEILGTLFKYLFAIIGVGAILAVLASVLSNNKAGTAAAQVDQMVANIQQLYAGQTSFADLTGNVVVNAGALPSGMTNLNNNPADPWGSAVVVQPHNGNASQFDVILAGVPNDSCAKIAGAITNYTALIINGNGTLGPAAAPAAIALDCVSASPATLTFTFSGA